MYICQFQYPNLFRTPSPPSHLLSPSSPLALNLSQHQGLFQWVSSLHQVCKILVLQLQHQSFQWIFSVDFLWDWLVWSSCCPRDSQESSLAPQFESINLPSAFFMVQFSSIHSYWKSILGCGFFPFITLNISWPAKFLLKNQLITL